MPKSVNTTCKTSMFPFGYPISHQYSGALSHCQVLQLNLSVGAAAK